MTLAYVLSDFAEQQAVTHPHAMVRFARTFTRVGTT